MKAYYLIVALAAGLAAIAMASQIHGGEAAEEKEADIESEMEAWFI